MSVLLIGHGYIGTSIARELRTQNVPFVWRSHDMANLADEPEVIINAAGVTGSPNVDDCEDHRAECIRGNILWPIKLEEMAKHIPVIHIGSGCIYGDGPWREDHRPNFVGSVYARAKEMAELALAEHLYKSYILRFRMPFGRTPHPRNLLTKLAAYPKLVNFRNSLTCVEDGAKIVVWFALKKPEPGIYNCTNKGSVTTREIADMMGLTKAWFASEAEFLSTVKAPRSNCILDTTKLEAAYPQLRTVHEALEDCIGHLRAKAA